LKLGRAQGVAIAVAMSNKLEVAEYSPKKSKTIHNRQRKCNQGAYLENAHKYHAPQTYDSIL